MIRRLGLFLGIGVFLSLVSLGLVFSQEETSKNTAIPETQDQPDMQWLWGEVISVDTPKNELLVKYLDYETDQEKEAVLNIDDKTAYENLKTLAEIKPKDTLSIDYTVNAEGKNIARNISLEKPESANIPPEGGSITPSDMSPEPGEENNKTAP